MQRQQALRRMGKQQFWQFSGILWMRTVRKPQGNQAENFFEKNCN